MGGNAGRGIEGYTPYITDAVYQRFAGDDHCTLQAFTTAVGMAPGIGPGKLGVMASEFEPMMSIQRLGELMQVHKGTPLHAFRLVQERHNAGRWARIWKGPPRVVLCDCKVQDEDDKRHCIAVDTARNMLWVAPSNRTKHIPGQCEGAVKVEEWDKVHRGEASWQDYMLGEFTLQTPISVWCVMVHIKRSKHTLHKPPPK